MSMTKTGIIGLVVLIVVLIGGYAIVTQDEDGGPLSENGTTTSETENGTTTDGTTTDEQNEFGSSDENADEDTDGEVSGATTEDGGNGSNDSASENEQMATNDGNETSGTQGNNFGGGIGGSGDAVATPQAQPQTSNATRVAVVDYSNADLGVEFSYPQTWDIDEDDEQVVTGKEFAGGMKSEMSVTVYEDMTLEEASNGMVDAEDVADGSRYQTELECKGDDLDCAGSTVYVAMDGEQTDGVWSGKVAKVSFGVYEMEGYEGPDVGVSPDELLGVTESTFAQAMNSLQISSS